MSELWMLLDTDPGILLGAVGALEAVNNVGTPFYRLIDKGQIVKHSE
jgi:hypothetical protein